jgi:hypothetical protein
MYTRSFSRYSPIMWGKHNKKIGRRWVEIWKSRSQLWGREIWQTGKVNLSVQKFFQHNEAEEEVLKWAGQHRISYSMEQSHSWEVNQFSAGREIPCILWNLKFHYRIHTCLPYVPVLSQLDPFHIPDITLPENSSEYNLPIYTWVSQVVSFSHVLPPKPCVCLSSPTYALHAPPISFSISSSEQKWGVQTEYHTNCRNNWTKCRK